MKMISVKEPLSVELLASLLGLKHFELMENMIKKEIFLAPHEYLTKNQAALLAARYGVILQFDSLDPHSN